jgi:hypothetical protein
MATYQSRGSFHSTEQLSFLGEGNYRSFLHFSDPAPPPSDTVPRSSPGGHHRTRVKTSTSSAGAKADSRTAGGATERRGPSGVSVTEGGYFGAEQDVSFCIVSEVLVARLTRWQVVFEDWERGVWLARGAPRRWWLQPSAAAPLFSIEDAPTSVGRVSFSVTALSDVGFTYAVNITSHAHARASQPLSFSDVPWMLTFPSTLNGKVLSASCVSGCNVVAMDSANGMVRVKATAAQFVVRGSYE